MRRAAGAIGVLLAVMGIAGCGGGSGGSSTAEVVAPVGAPYSFAVPSGFERVPATFPGKAPKYLQLVVPEGTEGEGYLGAYEWTLGAAQAHYPTPRLLAWLDRQTQVFYRSEGATLTAGKDETVAGHKAVCWQVTGFKNPEEGLVDADSCAIVAAPGTVVSQACTWKPSTRAEIRQGCEELRQSLKLS